MRLSEVAKLTPSPAAPPPDKLQQQVVRGKKRAKRFAQLGAGIGLGTLALRAPQAAAWAAKKSPTLAAKKPVQSLIRQAPKATKTSEALVPVSLGTGALGSINFASLQGKEAKQQPAVVKKAAHRKGDPDKTHVVLYRPDKGDRDTGGMVGAGIRTGKRTYRGVRVARRPSEDMYDAWSGFPPKGSKKKPHTTHARVRGFELETTKTKVDKADDKFLRKHRNYISEGAERAYIDLGERRDKRQSDRSAYITLASGGAAAAANRAVPGGLAHLQAKTLNATLARKHPIPVPKVTRPTKTGVLIAIPAAVGAGVLGRNAYQRNAEASSLEARREKIRAKAYERKEAGQYGRPAHLRKDHLDDVSKALWKIPTPGLRRAVRPGGLMRTATGKTVTRRGSIPGTGRLF